ncbi:unnamed protein product [Discula destructiva]
MRPLGDTPPLGHRASDGGASAAPPPRMSYTRPIDESAVDDALQQPLPIFSHAARDPRKHHTPQPGTAPAEALTSSAPKHGVAQHRDHSISASSGHNTEDDADDASWTSGSPSLLHKPDSPSLTPMMLSPSGAASAVSGVSSPRGSLFEEIDNQALSGGEELEPISPACVDENGSTVQLVMPSIRMPSRRPFTEKGKRIGRLKVLLAGDSGVGKTALIKAIVQIADAIVHVDPIPAPPPVPGRQPNNRRHARSLSSRHSTATNRVTEIFASTKPMPEWWCELDDSHGSRRRRSSVGGDAILDRNICFIDTPGYSGGSSSMETITPTVRYVESFFQMVSANGLTDQNMLNMLGGDGGNQVDAVLYLIRTKLRPADLKYLQLLAPLTNVIPVIAQTDTMTPEDIAQCKLRIRSELMQASIRPFSFKNEPDWPYAVSSLAGSDHDIMDASVLMSPDYLQPLVESELARLTEQMFCENGASWLRHAAAQKYLQWKRSEGPSGPTALTRPVHVPAGPQATNSLVAVGLHAYSEAGLADIEQQEERLARIRLSNWASRLQSSLRRERAQFEATARGERNRWLLEKLSEDVRDGRIVAVRDVAVRGLEQSASDVSEKGPSTVCRRQRATAAGLHQDPLGLVQVAANMKARSWEAARMLSGVGVIGGLVFCAARQGWCLQAMEWAAETWAALWHSERQ